MDAVKQIVLSFRKEYAKTPTKVKVSELKSWSFKYTFRSC